MLDYDIKPFIVTDMFRINKLFTMFNSISEPGTRFGGESHDFWECTYVKDGSLCNCVDGKVYNMEKGDLIFYKPMEFHQHHADEINGAKTFFFSFSFENCPPDFAADTVYKLNSQQRKLMQRLIDYADNAVENYPFTEEEIVLQKEEYINYKFVRALLSFSKNPVDMSTVLNCIYELFLSLYGSKNVVEETDSFHAGIYRSAVAFMTEHISEKVTISDIAKHCCISETSLKKVFYQFANTGIHKHLVQLKITHAIILLKSGISASETAQRTGFASQAYFSAAFKRETGLTPREYLAKQQ